MNNGMPAATDIWGLPLIDIAVIFAYFAVMLWIGFRAMRQIRNREDYFLAGRRFGKWIQTFAAFGQGTSAETAVTTTTMVSTNGAAGIGMGLASGLFAMPVFWMITMWYRRLRYMSLAEFFTERYGSKAMAGFYAVTQTLMFMIVAAMGFTAMSKTIAAIADKPVSALTQEQIAEQKLAVELSDLQQRDYRLLSETERARLKKLAELNPRRNFSYINRHYLTITLAVIVLVYAVSGGLTAAFITDMIQGVFIIILTFILIPFAMQKINLIYGTTGVLGTFEALHKNLPDAFFKILGSPNVPQFTWYFIVSFGIMGVINTAVQANQLTAAGSAKDDETARVGFVSGIFMKRYCSVIWGFVAMMTLLLYGKEVSDPDYVWGMATRELLCPGLVGLMIACLMAALMSTADALMLTCSSLLTNNVYKPLLAAKSESHYVFAGRIFCLIYIVGGVGIAIALDDVFALFLFMLTFNSMIAASFWLGMLWRRSTRSAAWTSIVITSLFTLVLPVILPLVPGIRKNQYLAKQTKGYTVANTYIAKFVDVRQRQEEIAKWKALNARGQAEGDCPEEIISGQEFTKYDFIKPQSIFWQKGLTRNNSGELVGGGMLKVELVALDWLGFDLSRNKHALNESMTAILRVAVPFGILVLVSLVTRPEDKKRLDFFYGKLRTPVNADHRLDDIEVCKTFEDPARFDRFKLFPNSNWEFRGWTKKDWKGQVCVVIGSLGVLFLMYLLVTLGK
jgi:SSS family solute:Na+ symporter